MNATDDHLEYWCPGAAPYIHGVGSVFMLVMGTVTLLTQQDQPFYVWPLWPLGMFLMGIVSGWNAYVLKKAPVLVMTPAYIDVRPERSDDKGRISWEAITGLRIKRFSEETELILNGNPKNRVPLPLSAIGWPGRGDVVELIRARANIHDTPPE